MKTGKGKEGWRKGREGKGKLHTQEVFKVVVYGRCSRRNTNVKAQHE